MAEARLLRLSILWSGHATRSMSREALSCISAIIHLRIVDGRICRVRLRASGIWRSKLSPSTSSSTSKASTASPLMSSPPTALAVDLSVLGSRRVGCLRLLLGRWRRGRRKRETLGGHSGEIRADLQRKAELAPFSGHREELKKQAKSRAALFFPSGVTWGPADSAAIGRQETKAL